MTRRFGLAIVTSITLACAGLGLAATPVAAQGRPDFHHRGPPPEWVGRHWQPWENHDWHPYWRPYVYATPFAYGYRYEEREEDCRWVHRKVRWVDDSGRVHRTWRDVQICD